MTTHVVRFSMDVSGSVISPLVMGQIDVSEFQTALAEVSNQLIISHDPGIYVQVINF